MTDASALTQDAAVARAIGRSVEDVRDVSREPLDYDAFLAGRSLTRIRGTANVEARAIRWSLIEKCTDGPAVASAYLYDNGAREFAAYRSGLLHDLAPGVLAPRLLAAEEDAGGRLTLWIEDVSDGARRITTADDAAVVARHLGRLAGRWLGGVPDHPWLFRDWIARHAQRHAIADGLAVVEAARRQPLIAARLGGRLDEAAELIASQDAYAAVLRRLPETLCHHDAVAANVFVRERDGTFETVLIDWESVGPGPVGADLASILFASPRRGDFSAALLPELIPRAVTAYAQGLRETGASVDTDALLLGLHASVALRWTLVRDVILVLDGTNVARRGSAPSETPERALGELAALVPVLLDSAAEARRAMGASRG